MSGRGRLEIGTYGDISTIRTGNGTVRAEARYRDGDGIVRKVTATAGTAKQAKKDLRLKLQRRNTATGFGTALSPESTVAELAEAWIEDVRVRSDLAAGTKDLYRRELDSLVLPTFKTFRLREVTTGRVDQFLKRQSLVSYAHARHSRVVLNLAIASPSITTAASATLPSSPPRSGSFVESSLIPIRSSLATRSPRRAW